MNQIQKKFQPYKTLRLKLKKGVQVRLAFKKVCGFVLNGLRGFVADLRRQQQIAVTRPRCSRESSQFCSSTILAADSDGDGFDDLNDAFPNSPAEFIDFDSDGVGDNRDAFPFDSSRQYLDLQGRLIRSVSKDCVEGELL